MDLEFNLGARASSARKGPETPLRLLVIGDFSGSGKAPALGSQKPIRIDVDNFDRVLARVGPRLDLHLGGADISLSFDSVEAFHPDELLARVPQLAAVELSAPPASPDRGEAGADVAESDASTFERLLGTPSGARAKTQAAPARTVGGINLDALIRDAIAPHITREGDTGTQIREQAADHTRALALRELLHDPAFQSLEAAWRGLHWLVCENDAGEMLEVSLVDASAAELARDVDAHRDDLRASALYAMLVTDAYGTFGGESYAAVIGNYAFAGAGNDFRLLAGIGAVAMHAGAPFIAGASPALVGGTDFADGSDPGKWQPEGDAAIVWQALRECDQAGAIGLALPHVLGRLPYGGRGDTIDAFDFDELSDPPGHEQFLWVNPAFACAQLIVAGFAERGWQTEPGDILEIADLPAALIDGDEGPLLQPCAETLLSREAAAHLLDLGLMAFMSHRDANVVRLARFQSIASPPAALIGPWARA